MFRRVVNADTSTRTMGLYDIDGSVRVRVADGSSLGLYDPDGAIRITISSGSELGGVYSPDGSLRVTLLTTGNPGNAENGSIIIIGEGIDPESPNRILMEDGVSYILMEDGASFILQEI